MFRSINTLIQLKLPLTRRLCTNPTKNNNLNDGKIETSVSKYNETYRKLDNLDFMTAAKILFTEPPKKKKFGIDFHLVQLFFACLPSLAVYLVAQYARHEMRKMDAELEQKKKKKEEEEAKEMELRAIKEKETRFDPELLEVRVRLDRLEDAVKDVVESKKQSGDGVKKNQEDGEKKQLAATEKGDTRSRSEPSKSVEKDHLGEQKSARN